MAHATITWSVTGEKSNVTGNAVARLLSEAGFVRRGKTAFRSAHEVPQADIMGAVIEALRTLQRSPGGGALDHVFVSIEGETPTGSDDTEVPEDFDPESN